MKRVQDAERFQSRLFRAGWMAMMRTWLAFSVTAFVTATACSVLDQDNPLRSDDPYIVGGIVAAFCAGLAFLSSITGSVAGSGAKRALAYFGTLFAFTAFLIGVDLVCTQPEGHGIATLLGVTIVLTGSAAYAIMKIPLTKRYFIGGSVPGLLYIAGYCCALYTMSTRGY
jgi:hypothetical protein